MIRKKRAGFSLLEIMIVVTIIGFLAGIAVPTFMKARAKAQSARCMDNLRKISGAKDQYAMENFLNNGDSVTDVNLTPFFKRGFPICPAGGNYAIGLVGEEPSCDIVGHELP